jgi:aspartyl-tRNA(Asn)/glutamyl-tRNA(Gln) amidotransferase subunit A
LSRIERGQHISAKDYAQLHAMRNDWIQRMAIRLQGFDAVLSPTTPITAPRIDQVACGTEQDTEFFRVNALLLRNSSVVNGLDGCAISLPCHDAGEMPLGLMAWQGALHDDNLLHLSLQLEPWLQIKP